MSCEDLFHDVVSIVQSSLRSLSFFFLFLFLLSLYKLQGGEMREKKEKKRENNPGDTSKLR
jgi:hypothetical protein